jgi:hypothetical protein
MNGHLLSTDRLFGLMTVTNYGWTSVPNPEANRGRPLGDQERRQGLQFATQAGTAIEELNSLREQPEVWLRVAAFVRRALGRSIELRESSGYLDPYIRVDEVSYSLLRAEVHGLRELIVLLAAIYRSDWRFLAVDEPELQLHPSLVQLWSTKLERECEKTHKQAIVNTLVPPRHSLTSSMSECAVAKKGTATTVSA